MIRFSSGGAAIYDLLGPTGEILVPGMAQGATTTVPFGKVNYGFYSLGFGTPSETMVLVMDYPRLLVRTNDAEWTTPSTLGRHHPGPDARYGTADDRPTCRVLYTRYHAD